MKEKAVENKIKNYLKSLNIYFFKNHGNIWTEAGRPDICGCYNGRFFAIEVKRSSGGIISDAQYAAQRKIEKNGGLFIFASSLEEVKEWIY